MEIKIRPAKPDDAKRIWEIRNEPASREVAASQEIIPLDKHIAWFNEKYFSGKRNACFVAEVDKNVIGYSRFDFKKTRYLNSIAIASSMHGQGIGTILLRESIKQLEPPTVISAEVRKHNTASIKMFERVGFTKESEDEKNIYFVF